MPKSLTIEQVTVYVHRQLAAVDQILAHHRRGGAGCCTCGRQLPCTVAATCADRRRYYLAKLMVIEQTRESTVTPPRVDPNRWSTEA